MAEENAIELRAVMARWDNLRERWALNSQEEAGLLGYARMGGPVEDPASWSAARMEQRMRLLVELGTCLESLMGDGDRIRGWLRRPCQSMGGSSPIQVMTTSIDWIRSLRRAAADFSS